ncbi:MAG: hypothetical protein ABSG96_05830 [Terracidiphilus sp.]
MRNPYYGLESAAWIQMITALRHLRRRLGIRLGLGAQSRMLLWLIPRESLLLLVIGLAIGRRIATRKAHHQDKPHTSIARRMIHGGLGHQQSQGSNQSPRDSWVR